MLNDKQTAKVLSKVKRFTAYLENFIFEKKGELQNVKMCHVDKQYHSVPELEFIKAEPGDIWEGEGTYCWFTGNYTVPGELAGKPLFIRPQIEGYEGLLFVNKLPFGTFSSKVIAENHGNHYCDLIRYAPEEGENIDIAIEYYAGHYIPGNSSVGYDPRPEFRFKYKCADICIKNYEIQEFYFDLRILNQLAEVLPETSFRRANVINTLIDVYYSIYTSTEDTPVEMNIEALRKVKPQIKKALSSVNSTDAPEAAIIGHSHMDTAWLWHVGETVKKCARTYSNQLSLMQQYPEYMFVQSSCCHSNMMRKYYPQLFEKIREAVKTGRYEPNGGVWVECDCNITGGESMIRQFLWGQSFTQKYFSYKSNCFWLPDTFGYSAAIPQIMKGCGVDYFLTTKISWNDTNKFPYDTFYWEGIDGTKVFTHFNTIHHYPDPADCYERVDMGIMQKGVTNKRLLAYGFGDGGGGPQFEMIESARRCENLEGCAKLHHQSVGSFMQELEKSCIRPNTYKGELYLELHRGTLTNQHNIKRNNRKAEVALKNLEFLTVSNALKNNIPASEEKIAPLYETLLLNQFHDILPGTCINRAHKESRKQMNEVLKNADMQIKSLIDSDEKNCISIINTLSFDRDDAIFVEIPEGFHLDTVCNQQRYKTADGKSMLILSGLTVPAFSSITLKIAEGEPRSENIFISDGDNLETPFYKVVFDKNLTLKSLYDKAADRQLVKGENLNSFMLAEDIPDFWDNWDVDADYEDKFINVSELISSEVVSTGSSAYIIRNKYKITEKSTVIQDMVFFALSGEIRFLTSIDWNDNHCFLKAAFDTDIREDFARHEIQFGYVKRPTTRNNSIEQAKFEVVNHKYSDLSELRYGAAVLNDCKYGISVKGGSMRLSLHKGGTHPDVEGDKDGIHECVYSFLPHNCGFSSDSVIKPAYMLNVPVIKSRGKTEICSVAHIPESNIIIETVKPCEDTDKAFIIRIYEAEGVYTNAELTITNKAEKAVFTDMLENETGEYLTEKTIDVKFRPFEIKTLKVYF